MMPVYTYWHLPYVVERREGFKTHERALRLVYKKYDCTFQELLVMDSSVTIHDRNLKRLSTEMFKVKNKLSPVPIQELFEAHV